MVRNFGLVCLVYVCGLLISTAYGQAGSLSELSGEDIVAVMQTFGDKCPPTTKSGENWAPIPKDTACGSVKRCDFPNQWCGFKLSADGTPDLKSLTCQPVADTCKQAFQGLFTTPAGGSAATTPAGTQAPSSPAGGTSPAAETPAATESSSPATEATTASTAAPETMPTSAAPESTPAMESTPPAAGSTPAGSEASTPSGECCDYHEYCCFWAATGECETNKGFMHPICKKSCGACGCNGDPASCTAKVDPKCSGADVQPGTACPCNSSHMVNKDWNPKCGKWAAQGDCDKNPTYMKAMCKLSCTVCK